MTQQNNFPENSSNPSEEPTRPLNSDSGSVAHQSENPSNDYSAQDSVAPGQHPTEGNYAGETNPTYGATQQPQGTQGQQYGNPSYNNQPYGATGNPYGSGVQSPQKENNVLGIIALATSGLGFILGCIPIIMILGWVLLFAGLVMGIIALFQKNKSKWAGITAIVLSVLGGILSAILGLVFAIGALSEMDTETGTYTAPESSASQAYSSSSDAASSSSSSSAQTGKIGDTYVWDDGVALTVAEPVAFEPSKYAAGNDDKSLKDFQKYSVTIKNDSDQPVDPSLFYMTGNSGGKEAERIFDEGLSSPPSTKIQPGKSVTFDVGYAMVDHKDVSFDVSLDFDRDEVTFVQG